MHRFKNKTYTFIFIACLIGYIWLFLNSFLWDTGKTVNVCLFNHITHLPCPSCGSTTAVMQILKGNFYEALSANPLGYIIFAVMLIAPLWILFDRLSKNDSFYRFYHKLETALRKRTVYLSFIFFILGIWIWNITKIL